MKNSNETESLDGMPFAGFWVRMLAFNTDLVFLLFFWYSLGILISDNSTFFSLCFAIWFLYDWLFTITRFRGTPGKRIHNVEIVDRKGSGLNLLPALIRTLGKVVSFALLMGGFTLIAFHKHSRGLHDIFSGSFVKYRG